MKRGSRVRLSPDGALQMPKRKGVLGTVSGLWKDGTGGYIVWDDRKSPMPVRWIMLEEVE